MTPERLAALALALDEVIPPSADGRLPGAGQLGLAEVLAERVELEGLLVAGLDELDERARSLGGADFAALGPQARREVFAEIPELQPAFFSAVLAQAFVAYYHDHDVMSALGLGGRPPFPLGYDVPETDLAILDTVRARAPFYRKP